MTPVFVLFQVDVCMNDRCKTDKSEIKFNTIFFLTHITVHSDRDPI